MYMLHFAFMYFLCFQSQVCVHLDTYMEKQTRHSGITVKESMIDGSFYLFSV